MLLLVVLVSCQVMHVLWLWRVAVVCVIVCSECPCVLSGVVLWPCLVNWCCDGVTGGTTSSAGCAVVTHVWHCHCIVASCQLFAIWDFLTTANWLHAPLTCGQAT